MRLEFGTKRRLLHLISGFCEQIAIIIVFKDIWIH